VPLEAPSRRLPLLGAILVLGAAFRLAGIAWGMHDANVSVRPHPDEWTVYYLITWFNQYGSPSPCPRAGSQCFFDWGMAFPYLAYLFHAVTLPFAGLVTRGVFGSQTDLGFVRIVLASRVLSALLSTATVYVVYRIGQRAYGSAVGLLAALCASLVCLLIQLGHFATPDTTTILLVSFALWASIVAAQSASLRAFLLCGAAWGLATASEYHMVLLACPVAAAWLIGRPRRITWAVAACAVALAAYVIVNIYALIDFSSWLAAMEHTLSIRTVDSAAEYGNRWSVYGSPWLYVVRYALGYGAGGPLTVVMVAATGWALYRRTTADLVLLAWLIPYFVLVSLSPAKFMRYSAPLLPVLVLFTGRFAWEMVTASAPYMRASAAVVGIAVLLYTGLYDAAYVRLFTAPDTRYEATVWLAQHHIHTTANGGRVAVAYEQLPNGLINLPYFGKQRGFMPCFTQFSDQHLVGQQLYLITDSYDLEEHPRISDSTVSAFRKELQSATSFGSYRLVATFAHRATVLGLTFPLDGSPHDWRYPDHVITIYQNLPHPELPPSPDCYPSLQAAHNALYTGTGHS
jgi:hypothetical protein